MRDESDGSIYYGNLDTKVFKHAFLVDRELTFAVCKALVRRHSCMFHFILCERFISILFLCNTALGTNSPL